MYARISRRSTCVTHTTQYRLLSTLLTLQTSEAVSEHSLQPWKQAELARACAVSEARGCACEQRVSTCTHLLSELAVDDGCLGDAKGVFEDAWRAARCDDYLV